LPDIGAEIVNYGLKEKPCSPVSILVNALPLRKCLITAWTINLNSIIYKTYLMLRVVLGLDSILY